MPTEPVAKKKNILLIFSDQHRFDALGCAGNSDVQTPNLDWLAKNGTRYENVWCQSPFCQPSRTSFITGLYPHQTGFNELSALNHTSTLMKKLQSAGYETATFGKMHYSEMANLKAKANQKAFHTADFDDDFKLFGWDHIVQEFDKYHHVNPEVNTPYLDFLDSNGTREPYQQQILEHMRGTTNHWKTAEAPFDQSQDLSRFLTDSALNWMENRDDNKPFFAKLAYIQPHPPLIADSEWIEYYSNKAVQNPSFERIQSRPKIWKDHIDWLERHAQIKTMKKSDHIQAIKHYYAMISQIDAEVGRTIEHLRKTNRLKDTIIIYTCDHGEMMGESRLWGKMNFYPGSVQVPLITYEEGAPGAQLDPNPLELIDLHKAIVSFANKRTKHFANELGNIPAQPGLLEKTQMSQYGEFASMKTSEHRITLHTPSGTVCEFIDYGNCQHEPTYLPNFKDSRDVISQLSAQLKQLQSSLI